MPDLAPACVRPDRALDLDVGGALPVPHRPRRCSTKPGSACCCLAVGPARAGWGSRCRPAAPRSTAWSPAAASAASSSSISAGRWPSATRTLAEDEIAELAAAKAPLIRLRGQWVSVDAEKLRAGWSFSERAPTAARRRRGAALAGSHPDDLDTPRGGAAAVPRRGWLGDLLGGGPTVDDFGHPPAGFRATAAPVPAARPVVVGVPRPARSRRAAWPTTWVSARPCSCSRWNPARQRIRDPAPRCCCARCRWSATGSGRRRGSRPGCGCYAHHGGAPARRRAARAPSATSDLVVTTYATATRDIDELAAIAWRPGGARRGAGRQEQPDAAAKAVRRLPAPGSGSRSPAHRWRTGWPSCGRSWTCSTPACSARPIGSASATRCRSSGTARRGGDAAARGHPALSCCAGSRPTRRSSPTCPRRSRSSSTAGSPPSRPRCTRRSSTT